IAAIGIYAFHPTLTQGSRFHLTGLFAGSPGLTPGAPVRVAGYDVGRVSRLERGPGNTAEVHMELDHHAPPLYASTTMRIRPRIFLEGGFYIDLQPGAPHGARLDDGATVPLSQTAIAVQSDQPLSRFDSKARASTATILHEFARALPVLDRYSTLAFPVLDRLPRSLRSTSTLLAQSSALAQPDALPRLLRTLTPTLKRLPLFEEREMPLFGHVEPVSECVTRKVD